jgi:hypothetical protein
MNYVKRLLLRQAEPIAAMRADLLDPTLFSTGGQRAVLYSQADAIVPADEVEKHIARARAAGQPVTAHDFGRCASL